MRLRTVLTVRDASASLVAPVAFGAVIACASTGGRGTRPDNALGPAPGRMAPTRPTPVRRVRLEYRTSPLADFVFFLYTRDTTRAPATRAVPLAGVPDAPFLGSFPERLSLQRESTYATTYRVLESLRTAAAADTAPKFSPAQYDSVAAMLRAAEPRYPAFVRAWAESVGPREQAAVRQWRAQEAACDPVRRLQEIARLPLRTARLTLVPILFHFSGSATADPPAAYSSLLGKAGLPWFVGHEGTHLLLSERLGYDFRRRPGTDAALTRIRAAGGQDYDLEESLALLMQVKLAQACGTVGPEYRIGPKLPAGTAKRRLVDALEAHWGEYVADPARWPTLYDYLLTQVAGALGSAGSPPA